MDRVRRRDLRLHHRGDFSKEPFRSGRTPTHSGPRADAVPVFSHDAARAGRGRPWLALLPISAGWTLGFALNLGGQALGIVQGLRGW